MHGHRDGSQIKLDDTSRRILSASQQQSLRRRLLAWYAKHARDLPWRRSRDPYRVWISEIMLQQTQVATVRDYFERFIRAFPDVHPLAAADEAEVLRLWEGLGYYRRARQLHAAAKKIVAEHGGKFPQTVDELQQLPGIGRYTAGAIASIAFDQRAPILEANTIRLLSRLIAYRGDPHSHGRPARCCGKLPKRFCRKSTWPSSIRRSWSSARSSARRANRSATTCPLSSVCAAHAAGLQHEIPLAKPRPVYTDLREAAVDRSQERQRARCANARPTNAGPACGTFRASRSKPTGRCLRERKSRQRSRRKRASNVRPGALLKTMKHGVTRYRITLDCYQATYVSGRVRATKSAAVRWLPVGELSTLPLSTTGRKIANLDRLRVASLAGLTSDRVLGTVH